MFLPWVSGFCSTVRDMIADSEGDEQAFWMLPCTQLFQSEAAGAFGNSATDLIEMRGFTTAVAAFVRLLAIAI